MVHFRTFRLRACARRRIFLLATMVRQRRSADAPKMNGVRGHDEDVRRIAALFAVSSGDDAWVTPCVMSTAASARKAQCLKGGLGIRSFLHVYAIGGSNVSHLLSNSKALEVTRAVEAKDLHHRPTRVMG